MVARWQAQAQAGNNISEYNHKLMLYSTSENSMDSIRSSICYTVWSEGRGERELKETYQALTALAVWWLQHKSSLRW